jgi:hypothetical protein
MGSERRIPGEGLAERMGARERRRPRIGMSPAFYTRLGLDDPWATPGAPEGGEAASNGMVFLSAAPFHAMMRKLAAARRRRDRRQERFAQARAGITMRAARRAWPGEGVKLPTSRLSALSLDAMLLPEAPAPASVAAASVEVEAAEPRRRNEPTPAIRTTWSESPFAPARVVRGGSASDHAGARIARAVQSVARAGETEALPQLARSAVARTRRRVEVEQEFPAETVEVVRRTRLARPVVRIIEEQVAPNAAAPVARAAARGAVAAGSARAPASRSPSISMAALAVPPSFERAAEFDSAAAQSLAAPERGEAMRPHAARRVPPATRAASRSAREASTPAASLSASPVSAARVSAGRPVAIAPVARTSVSAGGARGRSSGAAPSVASRDGDFAPVAALRRPARASAAAMARALHAAPVSEVAPESAPVRRRQDTTTTTAPSAASARLERSASGAIRRPVRASLDTTLPVPLGVSVDGPATAVALPAVRAAAEAPAAPVRSNTVRASMRAEPAPRQGAVSPRAIAADHTPSARAERPVRASAAVQLDNGSFISSRALAAMEGPAPALRSARGEALSFGEAAPRTNSVARRAAPEAAERPLERLTRAASPVTARATVASERPEGPMAWAAERLAPAVQPTAAAARSALRRVAPELRLPTPAEAPAVVEATEAPAEKVAARPVAARRAEAARPTAVAASPAPAAPASFSRTVAPTARAVAARKAGGVASAVARASRAAAAAPAVQAESATTNARRPAQVRRSGPLSWARPTNDGQLVASASPARRTDSPARPAAATPSRGWTGAPASPDFVLPHTALPEALAELRDAGLIQASWSPSTPVRTPDGRYVSARVAAAIPNLALLPSAGGPTAVSTLPQRRMAGFRSPEVRFVGAPTAQTAEGEFTGARTTRSRPTDWVGARSAVSEATAYRGAMGVRTPDVTFAGANSSTTPNTGFAGARSAVTESGQFVGARSAVTESGAFVGARSGAGDSGAFLGARTAATAGASAPSRAGTPAASGARATGRGTTRGARTGAPEALPLTGGRAEEVAEVQAPAQRAGRPSLESTLASVSESALPANAPTWAARSDGAPRVRSAQGLFESLARATTAEQVVGVIAARAGEMSGPVPLTDPMRAVVEQIRQELRPSAVAAEGTVLQTRAPDIAAPETTVLRPSRSSGPVASSAIMRSGGTRPVRSSALVRGPGGADDRVSKLVKRLTDLIHLAENERRLSEAQAQVRMAEDTAAARAEGSAPVGNSGGQGSKLDIETFAREVLEVVNRELELRRERRTEDGDESNWW